MKLYEEENKNIIYLTQFRDPFFNYLTNKIFSFMTKNEGRVLDLGCGSGRNVVEAAKRGFQVIGVDINKKSLEIAAKYARSEGVDARVRLYQNDLLKLKPIQFGMFDYIILQEVIEHIRNYQKLIDFAHQSLKSGGKLLLTTPNDPKQWNLLDVYAGHLRRFTMSEIVSMFQSYKEIKIFTIGFPFHRSVLTFYSFLLSRQHQKHHARLFRQNRLVHTLYFVLGSILLNIDNLFNFAPWGSTIVVIASK